MTEIEELDLGVVEISESDAKKSSRGRQASVIRLNHEISKMEYRYNHPKWIPTNDKEMEEFNEEQSLLLETIDEKKKKLNELQGSSSATDFSELDG